MGGTIQYSATVFQEPRPISEFTYETLKDSVRNNQYFDIAENESFYSKFSRHFKMILIGVSAIVMAYILKLIFGDKVETLFDWLSIPGGILLFIGLLYLFLEGISYSEYLQKSDAYFLRMKYALLKSNSYHEFNEIFYTIFSKDYDSDFKKWKKEYFHQVKK
jgi:hypothetical protein